MSLPVAALAAFYVLDIAVCPSRVLFGVPCPGCGLTRASVALAALDFERAMAFHPLVPLLLPLVGWAFGSAVLSFAGLPRGIMALPARLPRWFWGAVLVAVVGVWAVRLAGGLGGPPDPIDPSRGLMARIAAALLS